MFTTQKLACCLATIILLTMVSCPVWAQKSLDGDQPASSQKSSESKPPTLKSKSTKSGGKDFDNVDANNKPSVPSNPVKRNPVVTKSKEKLKTAKSTEKELPTKTPAVTVTTADAANGLTDNVRDNALTALPTMVTIPGGQFLMGSDTGLEYESPAHLVTLSSFEISKCEITNYQFQAFVNETGYQTVAERNNRSFTWKSYAIKGRDSYPVVLVTWSDAEEYCKWLSTKQNTTYRLPTESEWEYAARGGDNRQSYPWGDKLAAAQANFAPDSKRSSYAEPILDFIKPVGSYPANAFGLHDLIGNVFEWTADWFNEKYYQSSPSVNPMGPDNGKSRVIRGGSWAHQANYCTVFYRKPNVPDFPASYIGFRVVRVITDSSMH